MHRTSIYILVLVASLLVCNSASSAKSKELPTDQQVARLIEKMVHKKTEHKAFADLEALGCAAVPAIIKRMDDRRKLPDPNIVLTNKSPQAFEAQRFYGVEKVVDALDDILNQMTGQILGTINSSSPTEAQRDQTVAKWRKFLQKTPAEKLCD
jgi:hypothetical protein